MLTTRQTAILSVIGTAPVERVEVTDGFTLVQTQRIFARTLSKVISDLPPEIVEIHRETRGSPLAICLIAARVADGPHELTTCLAALKQGKIGRVSRRHSKDYRSVSAAIQMSIDSLRNEVQPLFESLAVFDDGSYY